MGAPIYADTSFLMSLYVQDANSARAVTAVEKGTMPIFFTPLVRHELQNALRLAVFRRQITSAQREAAWHEIEHDLALGMLHETPLNWPKALKAAEALSRAHTETLGARGMDVLHVGSALALRAKRFVTFDERQRELVKLAGLERE